MPDETDDRDDDVFTFGELDDHRDDADERRSTKRFALWALAVVVVVIAAAITLVSVLVDTSTPPNSPRATAQRWADDVVHGNTSDRHSIECDDAQTGDVLSLILYAPTGAHAGPAERRGAGHWSVPVSFDEAGGSPSGADVTVVFRDGAYRVC